MMHLHKEHFSDILPANTSCSKFNEKKKNLSVFLSITLDFCNYTANLSFTNTFKKKFIAPINIS